MAASFNKASDQWAYPGLYSYGAIGLHWLMAVILLANIIIGWTFPEAMPGQKYSPKPLLPLHISLGLSALILIVPRIMWRITHRPPPHNPAMATWERIAASLGHMGLYALMLAVPFSGWLVLSAHKVQKSKLMFFGLFEFPHFPVFPSLPPADVLWWHDTMVTVHGVLASWVLPVLITLHVGAVVKHHLVDRDPVLRRMWPERNT
ncbi:cytochrome b561 [Novosphingobium sp. SG751A]|uniref:cytochrome b n=1 Tax=Novosphingobium sp. SG751A TaxID=2587000 RepID=UPI0015526113|nr:cytochrome b [Novosphingobium sp. SG751A]NOW44731.1 cytochrome b561 [Novosphingobium sp. SG751A]